MTKHPKSFLLREAVVSATYIPIFFFNIRLELQESGFLFSLWFPSRIQATLFCMKFELMKRNY
jgi:hypothetical protein